MSPRLEGNDRKGTLRLLRNPAVIALAVSLLDKRAPNWRVGAGYGTFGLDPNKRTTTFRNATRLTRTLDC
jgi:hypothetical protein